MRPEPFKLERYFSKREFSARYLLSSSDCETMTMSELVEMADPEALELWEALRLGYTESRGLPLLREEIAGLYKRLGPSDVLCGAPEELIFLAMNALLEAGDHIVCTFPAYQSLYSIATELGCEVSYWRVREEENWSFVTEDLEALVRPETKAIIVNFPHNPTGTLPSLGVMERVVELARSVEAWLFSDEMYRRLELLPGTMLPAACDMYSRAVSLSGLSKAFGLAGLRSGWLASRDSGLIEGAAALKDYTTICPGAPSEVLSLIAIRARDTIIERNIKRIERNLDLLDGFFSEHGDAMSWVRPAAGSVCLAKLIEGGASSFCDELLDSEGVMLLPSTVFDYGDSHFRLGFGRENMPEALDRLAAHLSK